MVPAASRSFRAVLDFQLDICNFETAGSRTSCELILMLFMVIDCVLMYKVACSYYQPLMGKAGTRQPEGVAPRHFERSPTASCLPVIRS